MEQIRNSLLALESGEPIPRVSETSLKRAHNELNERINTPLDAVYSEPETEESDARFPVRIERILPVEDHPVFGPYLGLLCEATLEEQDETTVIPLSRITDVKGEVARKYVDAYNEWFWNFR